MITLKMESTDGKRRHVSHHDTVASQQQTLDRVAGEWQQQEPDVRICVQLVPELSPIDEPEVRS